MQHLRRYQRQLNGALPVLFLLLMVAMLAWKVVGLGRGRWYQDELHLPDSGRRLSVLQDDRPDGQDAVLLDRFQVAEQ